MPVTSHPLSDHFTEEELTRTSRSFPNTPTDTIRATLRVLCNDALEPVRSLVGPLGVNSGYRSPEVNAATPGAATKSAHLDGRAADVRPLQLAPVEAMKRCVQELNPAGELARVDQIIFEHRAGKPWLHVQIRKAGSPPRHQALMSLAPGLFELWDETDARLAPWRSAV